MMEECVVTALNGVKGKRAQLVIASDQVLILGDLPYFREIRICNGAFELKKILDHPNEKNSSKPWTLSIDRGTKKKGSIIVKMLGQDVVKITLKPNASIGGRLFIFSLKEIVNCVAKFK